MEPPHEKGFTLLHATGGSVVDGMLGGMLGGPSSMGGGSVGGTTGASSMEGGLGGSMGGATGASSTGGGLGSSMGGTTGAGTTQPIPGDKDSTYMAKVCCDLVEIFFFHNLHHRQHSPSSRTPMVLNSLFSSYSLSLRVPSPSLLVLRRPSPARLACDGRR